MTGPAYTERFDDAVALAVDGFRGTFRKSTSVAYVTHLFSVTALVGEYGGDEDQLIAAMLHDYIEDIDHQAAPMLRGRFGEEVAMMVLALSDATLRPKPPWRARKESYLVLLRDKPPRVKLVSAADKLHNCRCIRRDLATEGPGMFERFRGKRDGTLWYYEAVVGALGHDWQHPLLDVLDREVRGLLRDAAT